MLQILVLLLGVFSIFITPFVIIFLVGGIANLFGNYLLTSKAGTFYSKHDAGLRTTVVMLVMIFFFFLVWMIGGTECAKIMLIIEMVILVIIMFPLGVYYLFDPEAVAKYYDEVNQESRKIPFRLRLCHCVLSTVIIAASVLLMLAFVGFSLDFWGLQSSPTNPEPAAATAPPAETPPKTGENELPAP